MSGRRTFILTLIIGIAAAGALGYRAWIHQPQDMLEPIGAEWPPLAHLQATGDLAVIAGTFGGMADEDRFRITTTREVVTREGTYLETSTTIAIMGTDSIVQSAATGAPLDFAALVKLAPGSQISVLVQGTMQHESTVNAYVVIIP